MKTPNSYIFRALLAHNKGVFEAVNLFCLLGINKFHVFRSVHYASITII